MPQIVLPRLGDVDLAILWDQTEPKSNYLKHRLNPMTGFSSQLGTKKVDVVVLNKATPGLFNYITNSTAVTAGAVFSYDQNRAGV
ncbi:MAG: hypothetical protein GX334_04890 [Firmicutes bacterium]|nr:hypothetical protein [Bacillota bacterium]